MRVVLFLCGMLAASILLAQRNVTAAEFALLKWLVGSWKGHTGKEPFYEAWRAMNDSVLVKK